MRDSPAPSSRQAVKCWTRSAIGASAATVLPSTTMRPTCIGGIRRPDRAASKFPSPTGRGARGSTHQQLARPAIPAPPGRADGDQVAPPADATIAWPSIKTLLITPALPPSAPNHALAGPAHPRQGRCCGRRRRRPRTGSTAGRADSWRNGKSSILQAVNQFPDRLMEQSLRRLDALPGSATAAAGEGVLHQLPQGAVPIGVGCSAAGRAGITSARRHRRHRGCSPGLQASCRGPCRDELQPAAAMLGASIDLPLRRRSSWNRCVGRHVRRRHAVEYAYGVSGTLIVLGEDTGKGASVVQERSLHLRHESSMAHESAPILPPISCTWSKGFL